MAAKEFRTSLVNEIIKMLHLEGDQAKAMRSHLRECEFQAVLNFRDGLMGFAPKLWESFVDSEITTKSVV